jgi:hypothetical protein
MIFDQLTKYLLIPFHVTVNYQSVGSPYGGTALADGIAALGDVFGVGCGTNYDLTHYGASAWQAGIPSWARSAVHYHTTSFTDKWW